MPEIVERRSLVSRIGKLKAQVTSAWFLVRPRGWILVLGLVLMLVSRVASLTVPASSKFLIDDVLGQHRTALLPYLIAAVLVGSLIQATTDRAVNYILPAEAQRLVTNLRQRVQAHILRLPVAFLDSTKTGTLVARIMSDVEGLRHLIGSGLISLVSGLVTSALAIVVLLKISVSLTAVVAVCLLGFALTHRRIIFRVRKLFREQSLQNAQVMGRLAESIGGSRVIKAYCAETREEQLFAASSSALLQTSLQIVRATSRVGFWAALTIGFTVAAELYLGTQLILSGKLTLGELITFSLFLGVLVAPAAQLAGVATQLGEALAGLTRTREILNEELEGRESARTVDLPAIRGQVTFRNVSFAYPGTPPVLRAIDFSAEAGTITALVGPSGAGKSTLTELIASFHTPQSGTILIDGVDLARIRLEGYRRQLGIVLQDTFLFDGSIRENVAFSNFDHSEEDLMRAYKMARVDEFAERLEAGYDTVVGERGVKLSGGQRQRIAIARAILADPRILILDEATSSLDSESEALVQAGLAYLMQGRTTFVIAHRMSTIRNADEILVVDQGRLVGRGSHPTLYAENPLYRKLFDGSVVPEPSPA